MKPNLFLVIIEFIRLKLYETRIFWYIVSGLSSIIFIPWWLGMNLPRINICNTEKYYFTWCAGICHLFIFLFWLLVAVIVIIGIVWGIHTFIKTNQWGRLINWIKSNWKLAEKNVLERSKK